MFGSALAGRCTERPAVVEQRLPLTATLAVLPCRGGEALLRKLFEPLGYAVTAQSHPLDERFDEWGDSKYFTVTLEGCCRLQDLLRHLYVLVPVLDDEKHYWVGDDEVNKLLRAGRGWLDSHPEKELIASRYLKHFSSLARQALGQLVAEDDPEPDETDLAHAHEEQAVEKPMRLNDQRHGAVVAALRASGARRVLDLGCAEGRLMQQLLEEKSFTSIVGVDVSHRALEIAHDRLKLDRMSPMQRERVRLVHGSLTYRDPRLEGFDAAAVVEVVEHLDPPRLAAFERVLFECARPHTVVLTTPNIEYNVRFDSLPAGKFRHHDHRFEWTRAEFHTWAAAVADRFAYTVRFLPVGPEDLEVTYDGAV